MLGRGENLLGHRLSRRYALRLPVLASSWDEFSDCSVEERCVLRQCRSKPHPAHHAYLTSSADKCGLTIAAAQRLTTGGGACGTQNAQHFWEMLQHQNARPPVEYSTLPNIQKENVARDLVSKLVSPNSGNSDKLLQ